MAIEIRFNLDALPNPLSLPGAVTLTQTLGSNQPAEGVDVEYRLEDDHNVYFEDKAGKPTKTIQRAATVAQSGTDLRHRVTLRLGPGTGPMPSVEIDQRITDESDLETEDQVTVVVSASANED